MTNHVCDESDAPRFAEWLRDRGGIAVWPSINLSNLSASWTTPFCNAAGIAMTKPTWQAASHPDRIITDPHEVDVVTYREVKRFRVGVRSSDNGLSLKVTDGGSRRIRSAVSKVDGGIYRFDYETQEAVILAPDKTINLADWMAQCL